jgi:hypothetical protein
MPTAEQPDYHVWQGLHANVTRNHRCTTMTHLLGRIILRAA